MDGFYRPEKLEIFDETNQENNEQDQIRVLSKKRPIQIENETLESSSPSQNNGNNQLSVTEFGLSLITMFDNVKRTICTMINHDCSLVNANK